MALSYEFSIGSVRAKENSLLREADIEMMISLKSEKELVRHLKDKGYGQGETTDEILASNEEKMWKYIRSIAPDMELFEPFLIQNDIHNLKTVLKGTMSDREYDTQLMEPCTIKKDELVKAVENRRFDSFPQCLQRPASRAYQILAETKDARLSDAYIDRGLLDRLVFVGDHSRSVFLKAYFNEMVYYADIKTALRGAKLGVSRYYLEKAVADCEGLDKAELVKTALIKYLKTQDSYDCKKAAEIYVTSPSGFEKFTEDHLMDTAKRLCKMSSEGPEPLLGYYIACVYERKTIYLISCGLKTAVSAETIRERLRELYG